MTLSPESPGALLPCPFCGGEAATNTCKTSDREFIRLNGRDTGYGVNCISCGTTTRGFGVGRATEAAAIAAWNRRVPTLRPGHDN